MNVNSVWEKKTLKSLKFKAAAADVILQKPHWGREAEEAGSHAQHLWYYFSLNCYFHFYLKKCFFLINRKMKAFFISWKNATIILFPTKHFNKSSQIVVGPESN